MKKNWLALFFSVAFFSTFTVYGAQGNISGEEAYTLPSWFKVSFLELQEDVLEAKQSNKHIMLFMHIDRCPYCTRMLEENFQYGKNKEFIQKHFDVIALNIRGDREIAWDKNTTYSEKSLAQALKVMATPAIIFLNPNGQKVYQMNGYRKPTAFKHILNYINDEHYTKIKLIDYISQQQESNYTFKSHPFFITMTNFSKYKGPMAILFEDKGCTGCDEFHKEVLMHNDVMRELAAFKIIRLNAYSTIPIIDNKGNQTTAQNWVKALNLDYRPGTVLFDNGKEITRLEGRLYHFHYKELLRFVSGGFYKQYPTYIKYLEKRQKELLQSGIDIDFGK